MNPDPTGDRPFLVAWKRRRGHARGGMHVTLESEIRPREEDVQLRWGCNGRERDRMKELISLGSPIELRWKKNAGECGQKHTLHAFSQCCVDGGRASQTLAQH